MSYRHPLDREPCGTLAAYRRHERAGEKPVQCIPCRRAHAADSRPRMRAYRARKKAEAAQ